MTHIFVPSYHRADNLKTVKYFHKLGWDMSKVVVFIDSEADDKADYDMACALYGCRLEVFDMEEARRRYDYVHRPSFARRSAGQARNMFQDFAKKEGIDFYVVQDDDTEGMQVRLPKHSSRSATLDELENAFQQMEEWMKKRHIGIFGFGQTGDLYGGANRLYLRKVMNTTFYLLPYLYRGERGVQDDDTSMFAGVMNEGLFTGSLGCGIILSQTPSAQSKGGLTDLYNECKLLNKAMVVPIQFPSCSRGEKQVMNGGRLLHRINYRYLFPRLIKGTPERDNIAWDKWPEDWPFTNEPKR